MEVERGGGAFNGASGSSEGRGGVLLPSPAPPFTLRIVSLDHYLAPPLPGLDVCWSELEGGAVDRVPVVRIFGSTPAGQKTCLHLHKAFPYFYVPYHDDLPQEPEAASAYVRRLALALNAALNMTGASKAGVGGPGDPVQGANDETPAPGAARATSRQRVFGAALVRGTAFYGYAPDESLWVKIAMYDPKDVGRAASLLLAGAVLGRFWQPHESHVPYLLQLKVDLNLQGMGWLTLRTAKFRTPLPETFSRNRPGWATPATIQLSEPLSPPAASASNAPIWTEASTPSEMVWGGLTAPSRQSTCDLEVDGRVEDVTNRAALVRVPLQEASESTRMVESLAPMWEEEERRCGGAIPSPPPELPRTPQQLGHAAELLRAQFKEAEGAQLAAMQSGVEPGKSLSPEAGGQQEGPEVGSRGSGPTSSSVRVRSPLLAHTQAANDATLASELFFGAGGAAAKAGSGPVVENYDTFVDEAIVQTQLTMQPQPAEAESQEYDAEVMEWLAQHEEAALAAAGAHDDTTDADDEEDMLMALALRLTPTQRPSGPEATSPAAVLSQQGGGPLGGAFPGSCQQAAYKRAQMALEQMLAATQQECADILDASQAREEGNHAMDDPVADAGQQNGDEAAVPIIPQVDGAWDDEEGSPAATQPSPSQADPQEALLPPHRSGMLPTKPAAVSNVAGLRRRPPPQPPPLHVPAAQAPGRDELPACDSDPQEGGAAGPAPLDGDDGAAEASLPYISNAEVRVASQALMDTWRLLQPSDGGGGGGSQAALQTVVPSLPPAPALAPASQPRASGAAEKQMQLRDEDIPPTQPLDIESPIASLSSPAPAEVFHPELAPPAIGAQEQQAKEGPESQQRPSGGLLAQGAAQHAQHDAWWREEASQVPFADLDWDMLDENYAWEQVDAEHEMQIIDSDEFAHVPDYGGASVSLNDGVNNPEPGAPLRVLRRQRPPPREDQLKASCWEAGVLPIVHPVPHYSNPAHVPRRPPVFAGKEFRVPCTAVATLAPFSGESALEQAKAAYQRYHDGIRSDIRPKVLMYVRAQRPPSRAAVDAWAAAQTLGSWRSAGSGESAAAAGFVMDPNTGKLVPAGGAEGGATGTSQGSDLLATPSLASAPHSGAKAGAALHTPRAQLALEGQIGEAEARNDIAPASPKYDESTFFFTNPFVDEGAPIRSRGAASTTKPPNGRASAPRQSVTIPSAAAAGKETPFKGSHDPGASNSPAGALRSEQHQAEQAPRSQQRSLLKSALKAPQTDANGAESQGSKGRRVAFSQEMELQEAPLPAPKVADKEAEPGVHAAGEKAAQPKPRSQLVSQITPPSTEPGKATPSSQMGFKRIVSGKGQGLTLGCIEVHADCRGSLLPDPVHDAVRAVVLSVTDDDEEVPDGQFFTRILMYDGPPGITRAEGAEPTTPASSSSHKGFSIDGLPGLQIERFPTEKALLDAVITAVQSLDPDILMGYEVQKGSLGYLSDRAAAAYEWPTFLRELSRLPGSPSANEAPGSDQYGWQHASGLHVAGRIVLNVWRLMRGELKLNIYTLENVAAAVLRLRVPHIPHTQLAAWFSAGPAGGRWRCLSHLTLRARISLMLLDRLDLVGRTSEMARTFGIDFFSVLSRGSQYRVESMTLRLAHTQNYVALAPSPEQVARQPAMEALPLVMEPRSAMYPDPVCVLDFQSLYPSMIIAYNLCYSTCVGRASHAGPDAPLKLGCTEYAMPESVLAGGKPGADDLVIAPNGVAFVPPSVRRGVLPRLLNEILNTRIMVKAAMKRAPASARVLLRCLNARQFGLKLIANVTYGYTAAGFSGRMPMAELADAIVQSGRETLEAAIRMVESNSYWRAKVVYGDTDSLFVQLPGRSVAEAFKIGAEIAAAVTAANPPPVMLKLEKVYRPCVLLSKKRYVGAMYESPTQSTPTFDAKGIETVRRDACPAVAKIMERMLRILFSTADLSAVRDYLERQWGRILENRVSIVDFLFAKEVRLGTYSARAAIIPPAALVATRAMASDPRAEPRYGERVPYVVVYGEPGARLADMVVPPRALVESGGKLRLHALYYITKQIIPAVERVLSLVGADVRSWFAEMPRPQRTLPQKRPLAALPLGGEGGKAQRGLGGVTIDRFYQSRHCAVCDELTHASKPLCDRCIREPQLVAAVLPARLSRLEQRYAQLGRVCGACGGGGGSNFDEGRIVCDSLDCGVYFERRKAWFELRASRALAVAGLGVLPGQ